MVCAPESFIDDVLWPEYEELDTALDAYLCEVTEKVIREEVHGKTGEADEVVEPPQIAGSRYAARSEPMTCGYQGKLSGHEMAPEKQLDPANMQKVGRNAPCPSGSGWKFKKCCLGSLRQEPTWAGGYR